MAEFNFIKECHPELAPQPTVLQGQTSEEDRELATPPKTKKYDDSESEEKSDAKDEITYADTAVQAAKDLHSIAVETLKKDVSSRGMNHTEGGWPREVDINETEHKNRFRRKLEKDENYVAATTALAERMEFFIEQSNAINIYEEYFADIYKIRTSQNLSPTFRIVNNYRDSALTPVTVSCISFQSGPVTEKVAIAYSTYTFQQKMESNSAYIWNLEFIDKPELTLRNSSSIYSIEYNPKDSNYIVAGSRNGQVSLFDIRRKDKINSLQASEQSRMENSHSDIVISALWISSKSNAEFFSASGDGNVFWWDCRNLSAPTDSIIVDPFKKPDTDLNPLCVCSLEYDWSNPTKFMCGSECGKILQYNRKAKSPSEKLSAMYCGPLNPIYSIQRNPSFPKYFLSIGGWAPSIWAEEFRESSIITPTDEMEYLLDGCWSPTRSSVFFTVNQAGYLSGWDLIRNQNKAIVETRISGEQLTSAKICETIPTKLFVGTEDGNLFIVEINEPLYEEDKEDKSNFQSMLERETRREKLVESKRREIRFKEKHAAEISDIKSERSSKKSDGSTDEERKAKAVELYMESINKTETLRSSLLKKLMKEARIYGINIRNDLKTGEEDPLSINADAEHQSDVDKSNLSE